MIEVYVTRHGKTQWNIERRFQGAKDSPLVTSGIKDATMCRDHLKDICLTHAFSSPLGRAYDTASIIMEAHPDIQLQIDQRLKEMNFGYFEGMTNNEILAKDAALYDRLWNHPEVFTKIDGGETFQEVFDRIDSLMKDLKQLPDGSKVLLVTHGMYFCCLMTYIQGLEIKDLVKINRSIVRGGSTTLFEIHNDEYVIQYIGDDHYLDYEPASSYIIQQK